MYTRPYSSELFIVSPYGTIVVDFCPKNEQLYPSSQVHGKAQDILWQDFLNLVRIVIIWIIFYFGFPTLKYQHYMIS